MKKKLNFKIFCLFKSWGGKENGLDLVKCCLYTDLSNFPSSATAVNFEYTVDTSLNTESKDDAPFLSHNQPSKTIIAKHVKLEKVNMVNLIIKKNFFKIY